MVRRLAAIMFTDMVDSTAMAQANEAAALRLRDEQAELVRPLFSAHQGREIKSMGDGFLAEFDSALHAVQCAIDIQQHIHERNSRPGATPVQLRIGIHLGDVERRESDMFGDAVNIASRIEPLAPPGGVCISGEVYSQIRNKITNRLEKLPPTALKGVNAPVDLYRVVLPWLVRETPAPGTGPVRLAVLPFTNMSPDPADSFFADGLTEELITALSQLRELRVIARTSVMQYKSTTVEVSQIGASLGVSSVLEGSVRRAGNRLRITAQLIDVDSQAHIWAKSYDREVDDVFLIQSEVAKQVSDALKVELRPGEATRLEAKRPVKMDSYLAYLKGRALLQSVWTEEAFQGAKQQFELAISLDPTNARAYSGLADAMMHLDWSGWERLGETQFAEVRRQVDRALTLDPDLAEAHGSLGNILWDEFKNLEAEREFRLALSLNPSYAQAHYSLGHLLMTFDRPEDALEEIVLAEELNPNSVQFARWHAILLDFLQRFDEAAVRVQRLKELDGEGPEYQEELGWHSALRGDFETALRAADRLAPSKRMEADILRVFIFSATERRPEARKLIKELEVAKKRPPLHELGICHAHLGDLDACFDYLDRSLAEKQLPIQVFRLAPDLERVRSDPRFFAVLKSLNLAPVIS